MRSIHFRIQNVRFCAIVENATRVLALRCSCLFCCALKRNPPCLTKLRSADIHCSENKTFSQMQPLLTFLEQLQSFSDSADGLGRSKFGLYEILTFRFASGAPACTSASAEVSVYQATGLLLGPHNSLPLVTLNSILARIHSSRVAGRKL